MAMGISSKLVPVFIFSNSLAVSKKSRIFAGVKRVV